MHENLIFHVWFAIAFFHGIYLLIKMFPHFKEGYEYYIWLFFWIYNPNSLDNEGQKRRKVILMVMPVYFVVGLIIARF